MNRFIIPLIVILAIPLVVHFSPREIIKLRVFDALITPAPETGNFAVLNIEEIDVKESGGWPFPRSELAHIQNLLINKGASGVAWVISFTEPDRFGGDQIFSRSLSRVPSVIAAFETDTGNKDPSTTGTVILGDDIGGILIDGMSEPIAELSRSADVGIVSAPVEADSLLRRMPLLMRTQSGWVASLGTQLLKAATQTSTYVIKTNDQGVESIRVKQLNPIPTDENGRLWVDWINTKQTTLHEMDVNGRFVIVGVTAKGVLPRIATPNGLLFPHEIQAALAETMLLNSTGIPMPHIPAWSQPLELLIYLIGVLTVWLLISRLGITWGLLCAGVVLSVTVGVGVSLITRSFLVDVTWTVISQILTGSTAFYFRFREQYKLRALIKNQFEHYLDKRQVKILQDHPEQLKLGGERVYATYLFTDVRGFTAMSEKLPPETVTIIMNRALTAQVEAVQHYEGTTDKFIGDALMSVFGAPLPMENHAEKALASAVLMQKNIAALNDEFKAEGYPEIAIGIGVESGWAVAGNMGSTRRFSWTVLGTPVNTAARLESATKEVGVSILVGPEAKKNIQKTLKSLPAIALKGLSQKVPIYSLGDSF